LDSESQQPINHSYSSGKNVHNKQNVSRACLHLISYANNKLRIIMPDKPRSHSPTAKFSDRKPHTGQPTYTR